MEVRGARGSESARAAVFVDPEAIQIVDLPLPEPAEDEVRIRIEGCGVCGSNLPTWEGRPWFKYPLAPGAPGHEGWGVVDAIGSSVQGLQEGDRVAALSYNAFATHDLASADAVVKLPQALSGRPFPGEPLACAVNVFRRAAIQSGEIVAVVGVGFLGGLVTMLAARAGARVIAISRRSFALEMALDAGAEAVVVMDEPAKVAEAVATIAGAEGCDCVIEAVGNQAALDVASALPRARGRLIIAGYHQDGLRSVNMQEWNWKGIDVINAHERDPAIYRGGLEVATEMVVAGEWKPDRLYTHTFSLDELPVALNMMRQRPAGFMKAIIAMT